MVGGARAGIVGGGENLGKGGSGGARDWSIDGGWVVRPVAWHLDMGCWLCPLLLVLDARAGMNVGRLR